MSEVYQRSLSFSFLEAWALHRGPSEMSGDLVRISASLTSIMMTSRLPNPCTEYLVVWSIRRTGLLGLGARCLILGGED